MRSPRFFAIACRRQSNDQIVVKLENVENTFRKVMWLNKPFLRGTLALIDAFLMGYRALIYSANVQMDNNSDKLSSEAPAVGAVSLAMGEGAPLLAQTPKNIPRINTSQSINGIAIGATTVLSLLFATALFWVFPAFLSDLVLTHHHHLNIAAPPTHTAKHQLAANLLEGGIRVVLFLGYIGLISRLENIQRVFQYHGAEHKAINALEAGLPLTIENARAASRIHPRCGTNFIFIVLITSVFVFSFVPRHNPSDGALLFLESHVLRLLLLPVVAGIAYEILKFAGKHRDQKWAMAMIAPGLWTQYLTTRVPDDKQIEVAIASLTAVWDNEHATPVAPSSASHTEEPTEPAAGLA